MKFSVLATCIFMSVFVLAFYTVCVYEALCMITVCVGCISLSECMS